MLQPERVSGASSLTHILTQRWAGRQFDQQILCMTMLQRQHWGKAEQFHRNSLDLASGATHRETDKALTLEYMLEQQFANLECWAGVQILRHLTSCYLYDRDAMAMSGAPIDWALQKGVLVKVLDCILYLFHCPEVPEHSKERLM